MARIDVPGGSHDHDVQARRGKKRKEEDETTSKRARLHELEERVKAFEAALAAQRGESSGAQIPPPLATGANARSDMAADSTGLGSVVVENRHGDLGGNGYVSPPLPVGTETSVDPALPPNLTDLSSLWHSTQNVPDFGVQAEISVNFSVQEPGQGGEEPWSTDRKDSMEDIFELFWPECVCLCPTAMTRY